jgi:hypothetical protein
MFGSSADRDHKGVARIGSPTVSTATPHPAPPPSATEDDSEADSLVAHVERVMAADPERHRLRPAIPRPPRPAAHISPIATPTPDESGTVPDVRHLLRCGSCGWTLECLTADADRFLRAG